MQKRYPIKTNFEDLDKVIGGLYLGELIVLGAKYSIGKTLFLATLIKNITWGNGTKGLLFSLNNSMEDFQKYLIASILGFSYFQQSNPEMRLKVEELEIYKMALTQVCDLPLIIDDTPEKNINEIYELLLESA